jgi:hypothetical protein
MSKTIGAVVLGYVVIFVPGILMAIPALMGPPSSETEIRTAQVATWKR